MGQHATRVWQVFVRGEPIGRRGLSYSQARGRLPALDLAHEQVVIDRLDEWERRRQLDLFIQRMPRRRRRRA